MCFTNVLEAICRLSTMKVLPTAGEVKRAGSPSAYDYMCNIRRRRRRLVRQRLEADKAADSTTIDLRTLAQ